MSTFDVRNTKDNEVVKITFADSNSGYGCSIAKNSYGDVTLFDCEEDWASSIATKQDAENLIKALQKAIELGWFNA